MERFSVVDAGLRVCSVVWESRVHRSAGRMARLRAMLAGCRPGREIVGELRKVIDAGNNTIVTVQEVRRNAQNFQREKEEKDPIHHHCGSCCFADPPEA